MALEIRITHYGTQRADQFNANPLNPRIHPQHQRDVIRASLQRFGIISPVVVSKRSGYLIDGHERVWQALAEGDDTLVPYVEADVEEDHEAELILSYDKSTMLAEYDPVNVATLLDMVNTDDEVLAKLFAQMSEELGIVEANWDDAFAKVATEDREPFREMQFRLHDSQFDLVEQAMKKAREQGGAKSTVNENSNGNLLAFICGAYLNG